MIDGMEEGRVGRSLLG